MGGGVGGEGALTTHMDKYLYYRPADKVHLTPTEDIQDETFVGIWELHVLKARHRFFSVSYQFKRLFVRKVKNLGYFSSFPNSFTMTVPYRNQLEPALYLLL